LAGKKWKIRGEAPAVDHDVGVGEFAEERKGEGVGVFGEAYILARVKRVEEGLEVKGGRGGRAAGLVRGRERWGEREGGGNRHRRGFAGEVGER